MSTLRRQPADQIQVLHDGSNLRNEFKNAARQLVTGNYYNIFPQSHIPNPKDANHYIARKVSDLLNKKAGTWMHKIDNASDAADNLATQN